MGFAIFGGHYGGHHRLQLTTSVGDITLCGTSQVVPHTTVYAIMLSFANVEWGNHYKYDSVAIFAWMLA